VQAGVGHGWSILAQVDAGIENGSLGMTSWLAGAAYARYDVTRHVDLAARVDYVRETKSDAASSILIPVTWLSSVTATAAWRPIDGLDLRFEYRHDQAPSDAFFGGTVQSDLASGVARPNRRAQDTLTASAVAWF
jgi:hypothetical protein